jgi:hypothetical protein
MSTMPGAARRTLVETLPRAIRRTAPRPREPTAISAGPRGRVRRLDERGGRLASLHVHIDGDVVLLSQAVSLLTELSFDPVLAVLKPPDFSSRLCVLPGIGLAPQQPQPANTDTAGQDRGRLGGAGCLRGTVVAGHHLNRRPGTLSASAYEYRATWRWLSALWRCACSWVVFPVTGLGKS